MENIKYKLVCIDVDGTLLTSRRKVAESTKLSLQKAHELGVHIVISTGRMYTDAKYYSDLIGVNSAVIASNGAFIQENDSVIYKSILSEEVLNKLVAVFAKYRVKPCFSTPQKFYYGNIIFKIFYMIALLRRIRSREMDIEYIFSLDRCRKVIQKEKGNIVKCEFFHGNRELLDKIRLELKDIAEIELATSGWHNIEITSLGVSKGHAVAILAKLYGIKREEIMAIGDSPNDLSMIEYAGLGIAMGNAADEIKSTADYVTAANDQDGVSLAINKFILNKE